jgi:hypothetical protein
VSEANPNCQCVACHDYGDRDQADQWDLDTLEHVRDPGWGVTMIPADANGPGWAYTVGLWHSYGMPELSMFSLNIETMAACLNLLGDKAKAGKQLAAGQQHGDIVKEHQVELRSVGLPWYRAFFGGAIAFYRRTPFPFLQVVWPTADGLFPWELSAEPPEVPAQPWLWLQPGAHPRGVWTQDL